MSNEFIFTIIAIWLIGFVSVLAKMHKLISNLDDEEQPVFSMKCLIFVLILLTWPYWHFYYKD